MDSVQRVTEGLTDEKKDGLRSGRECIDEIFTLKQMCMFVSWI